jgi:hypothetical protein
MRWRTTAEFENLENSVPAPPHWAWRCDDELISTDLDAKDGHDLRKDAPNQPFKLPYIKHLRAASEDGPG